MVIRLFSLDARTPQDSAIRKTAYSNVHENELVPVNSLTVPFHSHFKSFLRSLNLITIWKFTLNTLYALANLRIQIANRPASMLNVSDRNSAVYIGCRYGQEHRRGTLAHAVVPVPCMLLCTCWQFRLSLHPLSAVRTDGIRDTRRADGLIGAPWNSQG